MAYISAIDDEEEDKPAATAGAAPPVAGQGAAPGPAAQQQLQAPQQSKFVNFSQFLNANRGAAQATAGKIVGGIGKQAPDIAGAQQRFGQAVQAGSQTYTAGRSMDEVRAAAAKGYSGPNSMADAADWAQQQERARKVQDSANATAGTGGLGAMLQQQNPGAYSGGNRRLDTALTGHVGAEQFADARAKYGSMADALNKANEASAKTAEAARGTSADAQGKYGAELATREAQEAAIKQTADEDKLLGDVSGLIDTATADFDNPQHKNERRDYLIKTGQLQRLIDTKYGPGAWDRYVAAKEKREQARTGAVNASFNRGAV